MLRVICGQCGKKLEIPDAWAHNVVKCPQCREPIDLQERDSAECAVKLGQFLNENLGGDTGAGRQAGAGRPTACASGSSITAGSLGDKCKRFVKRHRLVVAIAGAAVLLILLDAVWLHTGTVTVAALAGGLLADRRLEVRDAESSSVGGQAG